MIYLVISEYAEYSEYRWWTVVAYDSREIAEDHAERAQLQANLAYFIASSRYAPGTMEAYDSIPLSDFDGDDGLYLSNPYDPDPKSDFWSERHRFHEVATSSNWGPLKYRVREVPMGSCNG